MTKLQNIKVSHYGTVERVFSELVLFLRFTPCFFKIDICSLLYAMLHFRAILFSRFGNQINQKKQQQQKNTRENTEIKRVRKITFYSKQFRVFRCFFFLKKLAGPRYSAE